MPEAGDQPAKPLRTWRPMALWALGVFILFLAGWRGYRQFVPSGAGFTPYVLASIESGRFTSPQGTTTVTIVYNDAGATHSGNHWTWIVVAHWLTGKRVVGQGYSLPDIISRPPEIKWIDAHSFTIPFAKGRHDQEAAETLVTVKE